MVIYCIEFSLDTKASCMVVNEVYVSDIKGSVV
jgi:hypothetical protein